MQAPSMPDDLSVVGTGGPIRHGHNNSERRSCSTCAIAKTKCIPRAYGPCERCHRLKKPCHQQEPAVRKPRGPAKKSSRKEQLEAKLDSIMSLLSERQKDQLQQLSPPDSQASPPLTTSSASDASRLESSQQTPVPKAALCQIPTSDSSASCDPEDEENILPSRSKFLSLQPAPPPQGLFVSDLEAEEFLHEFKTNLAPHFPFIVIPTNVSARSLRQTKPFLCRTVIMAAMYCDHPRQFHHVQENIRYFSEKLLVKGEKTLDLLQGLLVLAAWYHVQHFMNPQLTNFCSLATALVIDLGLTKTPQRKNLTQFSNFTSQLAHGDHVHPQQQTSEERRALLGCYYLTSLFSACFKRLEGLPFTQHLQDACQSLEDTAEYHSDLDLVALVRVQNVIDRLRHAGDSFATTESLVCPVTMYVKAFMVELDSVRDNLKSKGVGDSASFRLMCATAEMQIYENVLQEPFRYKGIWHIKRLEIQYKCFLAAKELFDAFAQFPAEQLYHMSFSAYTQVAYGMSVLSKLQVNDDSRSLLQEDTSACVDLIEVLERVARQLETAVHTTKYHGRLISNDKFLHWSICLRRFKDVYMQTTGRIDPSNKASGMGPQSGNATPRGAGPNSNDPTLSEPMDPGLMEFFADDNFWSSMMSEAWNGEYYGTPTNGP